MSQTADSAAPETTSFTYEGRPVTFVLGLSRDYIQNVHREGRFYETRSLERMRDCIPAGAVVLDIGTNVGNHAIYFDMFTRASKVFVFEPNPLIREILLRNIALNPLTKIDLTHVETGLSNVTGVGSMIVEDLGNWGSGHLIAHDQVEGRSKDAYTARVALCPLDSLNLPQVDFIKMDVEGHELEALRGGRETIARCKPVIFLEVSKHNRGLIYQLLTSYGYVPVDCFSEHLGLLNMLYVPVS